MADAALSNKVVMRCVFTVLCLILIFVHLLPLETTPRRWAGPEFMVVLALAWSVRQPEYTPPLLIAGVFLLADFLLLRPPGLGAAIMVFACEIQRSRSLRLRDATFATEWLTAAAIMLAITLGYRLVGTIFLLPLPSLGLMLMQTIMNIAIYPGVVFLSHLLFGVRRSSVHDTLGAN
ncbi:rod shape-determining protein MreD [Shimia sagamensis]|uniref:Rod shape-determining protein MreD n=1 Tax=Shimia sagamensis TaxID=1566352 RepID=A0ABY1P9U4_9RHOB|nr:rod shape-determining protein MreD [Shimia sagamensis]SMP28956.1 rod shape-determining protein MreD [Shimia sagamensis]